MEPIAHLSLTPFWWWDTEYLEFYLHQFEQYRGMDRPSYVLTGMATFLTTNWLHGTESVLRSRESLSDQTSASPMESQVSLPRSPDLATGSYPEPVESSPHPQNRSLSDMLSFLHTVSHPQGNWCLWPDNKNYYVPVLWLCYSSGRKMNSSQASGYLIFQATMMILLQQKWY
jgi:hypothetical protein